MSNQHEKPAHKSTREYVLRELVVLLRERNKQKSVRFSFLDRPIALAILGTIAVAVFSAIWQSSHQKTESTIQYRRTLFVQKCQLLPNLSSAYQKQANILNSRILHTFWVAEQHNKSEQQQNKEAIKNWSGQLQRLEQEYTNADILDGVLAQVEALFTKQTRDAASNMRAKFSELEQLAQQVIQEYNPTEHLTAERMVAIGKAKSLLLRDLDVLYKDLSKKIGSDLVQQSE